MFSTPEFFSVIPVVSGPASEIRHLYASLSVAFSIVPYSTHALQPYKLIP